MPDERLRVLVIDDDGDLTVTVAAILSAMDWMEANRYSVELRYNQPGSDAEIRVPDDDRGIGVIDQVFEIFFLFQLDDRNFVSANQGVRVRPGAHLTTLVNQGRMQ